MAGTTPTRVRLTDQALVAVTAARQSGEAHGRHPTVADLLVGLAAEPDGQAGGLLRTHATSAARLLERAPAAAPDLPPVEAVLARGAAREAPRAVPTRALLAGLLEVGGTDVVGLLAACGFDPGALYRAAVREPALDDETFGLGSDPDLSADAATAVARVRAAAGGAVALVIAIAATPGGGELLALDPGELSAVGTALRRREDAAGPSWDRGLDVVLDTVRAWRDPPLHARDLLRAAVSAGGNGPRRLVEESARRASGAQAP